MAATTLAEGRFVLHNVPDILDVECMSDLLRSMGMTVTRDGVHDLTIVRPANVVPEAPYELVERMRASIVVLGPLLARFGRARVALPGGDDFGPRPIDMHLKGLEQLGATFEFSHGYIEGHADALTGANILLEYPSVGATENALMAAVLAKGPTVIDNAAREPEIADLAAFLNRMGAQVLGAGSSTIRVEGVDELSAVEHTVIPDRIEAATFLAALGVAASSPCRVHEPSTWTCSSTRSPTWACACRAHRTGCGRWHRPGSAPSMSRRCPIRESRRTTSRCSGQTRRISGCNPSSSLFTGWRDSIGGYDRDRRSSAPQPDASACEGFICGRGLGALDRRRTTSARTSALRVAMALPASLSTSAAT